jgi:Bifunctional DNA primase/polymerase, N-terminal
VTDGKGATPPKTAPDHQNTNKDAGKSHCSNDDGAGEDVQTGLAFIGHLDELGIPLWVAQRNPRWPDHGDEFFRPKGWQKLTADGNVKRETFSPGEAVCVNTGGKVVVVDVDPRNGGDTETVRALLAQLKVRIFAEINTAGGGRHFYVAGHPELPSVHSTAENNRLPGFPGVDIQSFGCNVFVPLTERPKYQGKGYTIVSDDLEALACAPADAAEPLARWVGEQLAGRARRVASAKDKKDYFALPVAPPWSGAKPDARQ